MRPPPDAKRSWRDRLLRVAIGQRLEEGDEVILLLTGEAEIAARRIEFLRSLRRAASTRPFPLPHYFRIGEHISRVVEVHDLLQALEIAVVTVSLYEIGRGRLSTFRRVGTRKRPSNSGARAFHASFTVSGLRRKLPTPRSTAASPAALGTYPNSSVSIS